MRKITSVLLLLAAACVGCGDSSETVVAQAPPTRPSVEKVAPPSVPPIAPIANNNSPQSPIGLVCWTRREIVISLARGLTAQAPETRAQERRHLSETLNRAAQADLVNPALPAAVSAFATRFKADIDRALVVDRERPNDDAAVFSELNKLFIFEEYPHAKTYIEVAVSDPNCKEP